MQIPIRTVDICIPEVVAECADFGGGGGHRALPAIRAWPSRSAGSSTVEGKYDRGLSTTKGKTKGAVKDVPIVFVGGSISVSEDERSRRGLGKSGEGRHERTRECSGVQEVTGWQVGQQGHEHLP